MAIVPAEVAPRPKKAKGLDNLVVQHRLCIGSFAVPTVEIDGKRFAKLTSTDNVWLLRAVGIKTLHDLPDDNVLTRIKMLLADVRGKPSRFTRRVDKSGAVLAEHVTLNIDGHDICVGNVKWPVHIEATVDSLTWLLTQMRDDASRCRDVGEVANQEGANEPNSPLTTSSAPSTAATPSDVGVDLGLPADVSWWPSRRTFRAKCQATGSIATFRVPKSKDLEMYREKAIHFAEHGAHLVDDCDGPQ
jgi:hypothetical protein